MKEAALAFNARNVLIIAHNTVLETIRLPVDHEGGLYDNFTITNNTKFHMPGMLNQTATDDSTSRSSDETIAKLNWAAFGSHKLYLQGYFDLDFL